MTKRVGLCAGLLSIATTLGGVAHADSPSAIKLAATPVLPSTEVALAKDGSTVPMQLALYGYAYTPRECRGTDCRSYQAVAQTASMLPMGAFLVTVDNTGDAPIVVSPKDFTLALGDKTEKALPSEGDVGLRWRRTLHAMFGRGGLDMTSLGMPTWAAEDNLAILDGKVTIAPHTARSGYVVFDVGAYTPAEYGAVLKGVSQAQIQLHAPRAVGSATIPVSNG